MNYLFAFCVSLFLVSFIVADHPGHDSWPKFCTKNVTKCEMGGINVTCVAPSAKGCAVDVGDGNADMTLATANDLVKNEAKLKIVYAERETGVPEDFVKYYGLAVVEKGSSITLNNLKGKKSCHTGAGKTVGWNIPVGYLISTEKMEFKGNAYNSAADFFSESCVPGVKDKTTDKVVITDLCKLCNSTGVARCTGEDGYADYVGAFKCMAEGDRDRVGFVKQTTPKDVFDKDTGNKYGDADDYELLCKDGKKKALAEFQTCNIDKRPAYAVVTKNATSADTITKYKALLDSGNFAELKKAGIASSGAERFVAYTMSVKDYVGDYADYYNAANRKEDVGSATAIYVSFALEVAAIFALVVLV